MPAGLILQKAQRESLPLFPQAHIAPASTIAPQAFKPADRRFKALIRRCRLYLITDSAALFVGFFMSLGVATLINNFYFQREVLQTIGNSTEFRMYDFLVIASGTLLWLQHKGHYRMRMNFWLELKVLVFTMGFAMMADGFFQFATKLDLSRLWLVSVWGFTLVMMVAFRMSLRYALRRLGLWEVRTLLVGGGTTAADTEAVLAVEASLGFKVVKQIRQLPEAFMQAGRSWAKLCGQVDADYVVIALDGHELERAEQPIAQLMREHVPFSVSPPRRNLPVLDMMPQYFFNSDIKLLTPSSGLEQPIPQCIKRLFDIAVAGSLVLLLSPLLVILAVLTKRDGGPVFFKHARLGKKGNVFHCLKFRSMIADSAAVLHRHLEENPHAKVEWEATQKLKDDPRITSVGQFLRSTSLDELPQLINVLRGEMSLVGPRPIVESEVQKYKCDIAHYYRVSPGITGLWQVSGRNDVSYEQRVQMDSWYVRNWSLWHDIAILCKTLPALLKRSGAY